MSNILEQTEGFLCSQLSIDSVTALALSLIWLDPLQDEDMFLRNFDEELYYGLSAFKRVTALLPYYSELAQMILTCTFFEFESRVTEILEGFGIYVPELIYVAHGIPLPQYGVDVEETEFFLSHPDVETMLDLFGVIIDHEAHSQDIPSEVYEAGRYLHQHLLESSSVLNEDETDRVVINPDLHNLSMAIGWVFSCTGNSSVDYSIEEASEWQPLDWDDDSFNYALEIMSEADTIIRQATAGMELLNQPQWVSLLKMNIANVFEALGKGIDLYDESHECKFKLEWSLDQSGFEGTAAIAA